MPSRQIIFFIYVVDHILQFIFVNFHKFIFFVVGIFVTIFRTSNIVLVVGYIIFTLIILIGIGIIVSSCIAAFRRIFFSSFGFSGFCISSGCFFRGRCRFTIAFCPVLGRFIITFFLILFGVFAIYIDILCWGEGFFVWFIYLYFCLKCWLWLFNRKNAYLNFWNWKISDTEEQFIYIYWNLCFYCCVCVCEFWIQLNCCNSAIMRFICYVQHAHCTFDLNDLVCINTHGSVLCNQWNFTIKILFCFFFLFCLYTIPP